jgi:hypothetical protein
MEEVAEMEGFSKHELPSVVARAVTGAGLDLMHFPDLALRIINGGAVTPRGSGEDSDSIRSVSEWVLLNPGASGGIRVSRNALNPIALVQALLLSSSASVSVSVFISALLAIFAAFGAAITRDQAALLVALKRLEAEGRARTVVAVAGKMTILVDRPISTKATIEIVEELRRIGVQFRSNGDDGGEIVCEEKSVFLGSQGP